MKKGLVKITTAALIGASLLSVSPALNSIVPLTTLQAASKQIKVSQAKAVKIFKQTYGNKKINEITLEKQAGKYVYEIDGFSSTHEYTVVINAQTGKVIRKHSERDHDHHGSGLNLKKTISKAAAEKIAKKHVKGSASKWTLEKDDGLSVWEIKIGAKDVKINALNKKLIEIDD